MNEQPGMRSLGSSLRLWQIGAIFLPYLLVSLLPLRGWAFTNEFPWLISVAGIPLLGLLAVIWIFGLAREFPVWAMPALGIILYLVSAFFHLITQFGLYFAIYKPLSGGMGWIGGMSLASIGTTVLVQLLFLFIVVGLILGLMRIVPRFQARVREEWTLLSFLLFGMAIVPITFAGDEFDSVGWHQIASLTTLVISAGLYLIASQRWQRVFVLVAAVVLAPAIMSLGLYQVFPAQSWVNEVEPNSRIWEALQPVFSLSTMPLLLLLPALIPRMPWFGSPATSHSIESHS